VARWYVLVDADALAGWRRLTPSLRQLWDAVGDLHDQFPDASVAVVADATLKWDLDEAEQEQMEEDVVARRLVYPPAGSVGGQAGFLRKAAERAEALGFRPVLITDQRVPGIPVCRVRRRGEGWAFDLNKAEVHGDSNEKPGTGRRRRRRPVA